MNEILFYTNEISLLQRALVKYSITEKQKVQDLYCLLAVGNIVNCRGPINRVRDNLLFNFHKSPIPDNFNTPLSFDDVALTVAESIWKKHEKVSIFWSGGIDSTAALSALIMTNSNWKNCIEVYTTSSAIEKEYPLFYDKFLRNGNVKIMEFDQLYDKNLFDDKFVIDGNLGGLMWYSDATRQFSKNFKDSYQKFFDHSIFTTQLHKKILRNYIEEMIYLCPVQIKSIFDVCWWLGFTHKWDNVRLIHRVGIRDARYTNSSHSFYADDLFQRWSISNMDKKIKDDWKTLKWPAKDLIYRLTKDNCYRINKEQKNSIFHKTPNGFFVVTDGSSNKFASQQEVFETCIKI